MGVQMAEGALAAGPGLWGAPTVEDTEGTEQEAVHANGGLGRDRGRAVRRGLLARLGGTSLGGGTWL